MLSFIDGNFGLVSPYEPEYDHNKSESDGQVSRRCRLHDPRPDHQTQIRAGSGEYTLSEFDP